MKNAHAALKTAIASKGVDVPDGTKLTDMPALVEQISTEPVPTNPRAVFAYDKSTSMVVPKLVVVDVTAADITYCFYSCSQLTSLTLPAGFGQNGTNFDYCFYNCTNLASLNLPAGFGQKALYASNCFYGCSSLTSLTLPAGFGQNATSLGNCFGQCPALTNITGNPNFKVSVDFSFSTNLTHDSLMVIINGLQTVTTT